MFGLKINIINIITYEMKTKLEQMVDFMEYKTQGKWENGDIWQQISDLDEDCHLACMDISLSVVKKDEFGGYDFSGKQQVYEIFFEGSGTFFAGIWIGDGDINRLDEYPVYFFDIENDEEGDSIGNFRDYINMLLNLFFEKYDKDDEYMATAKWMQEEVKKFSTNTIDKGRYSHKLSSECGI